MTARNTQVAAMMEAHMTTPHSSPDCAAVLIAMSLVPPMLQGSVVPNGSSSVLPLNPFARAQRHVRIKTTNVKKTQLTRECMLINTDVNATEPLL
eukprot:COSAG01_NODE_494_length_16322_cov_35.380879_11_plen_95_part_00